MGSEWLLLMGGWFEVNVEWSTNERITPQKTSV